MLLNALKTAWVQPSSISPSEAITCCCKVRSVVFKAFVTERNYIVLNQIQLVEERFVPVIVLMAAALKDTIRDSETGVSHSLCFTFAAARA